MLDSEEGIRFRGKTVSKTELPELLEAIPNKIADPRMPGTPPQGSRWRGAPPRRYGTIAWEIERGAHCEILTDSGLQVSSGCF